jgi:putative DNA primase/helicase
LDYDPTYATKPDGFKELIDKLIGPIFCFKQDLINDIQKHLGACLTGDNGRYFAMWCGNGRNGKSLLIKALKYILGQFASNLSTSVFIKSSGPTQANSHTSHLMALQGIRMGYTDEIDNNARLNESNFKKLASNECVRARGCGEKKETDINLQLKPILLLNAIPKFDGFDPAIQDRLAVIPFDAKFVEKPERKNEVKADAKLEHKMLVDGYLMKELFAWMIEGAYRCYNEGFELNCKEIKARSLQAVKDEDPLQQFLDDKCEIGEEYKITTEDLFSNFKAFMKSNFPNEPLPNMNTFGKMMSKKSSFESIKIGKQRTRGYKGLKLIEDKNNTEEQTIL